jgi:PRTRC genetic system protein A
MKLNELGTPVYLKTEANMEWPKDKFFYLLSSNGLFIGRNHLWFKSCVKAENGPGELAWQEAFCSLSYPKIPRVLMEKAVGFFHKIYHENHWESALVLVWNQATRQVELLCPEQKVSYGSVNYDLPNLPPGQLYIGDIHSHCNFSPESSSTDEHDERNRPGIHLVAGFLAQEPPEFYAAVVCDGQRFKVNDPRSLMADYHQRDPNVPAEWFAKVKEKEWKYEGTTYSGGSYYSGGGYSSGWNGKPSKSDRDKIKSILDAYLKLDQCPQMTTVRQCLYSSTRSTGYLYCEHRAQNFVDSWAKLKAKGHYHEEEAA